jgi:two-component system NtrC family sensor kinase
MDPHDRRRRQRRAHRRRGFGGATAARRAYSFQCDRVRKPSDSHSRPRQYRFLDGRLARSTTREGKAIGVLIVYRYRLAPFTVEELAQLQSFADQAVIAIENARLFKETKEALEGQTATAEILKVIASSPADVQPVFNAIAERARLLCGARVGSTTRFDGELLHLVGYHGASPEGEAAMRAAFPMKPGRGSVNARTILAKAPVQIVDVDLDPEYRVTDAAQRSGFRSGLGVPLLFEGRAIGSIFVGRAEPGAFPERLIALLQTFADQAVIAIQNVKLFEEVQAKTRDLEESLEQQTATADVLKVISRSAFDLDTVLATLISTAARLCNAGQAQIFRRDGDVYRSAAMTLNVDPRYRQHEETSEIRIGRGTLIGRVALSKQTAMITDAWSDPEYEEKDAARMGNLRAMLGVPLLRDGEPIGAFGLARTEPGAFTEREVELVTGFADQAVIAVENARLFNEVQARTKELAASLDELRAAQDRLVQTEKLASLGQLTAGIAHEIKNPLNFVNNFAALSAELTDELNDVLKSAALAGKTREEVGELTGMLKENLGKVVQHGKRADSIVKNMLLHSREGSGEHRPADINALLEESLNLAYHGARAEKPQFNVALQRDFDEAAGTIDVFPQEITRVFLNLISNSFYAVTKRKTENGSSGFEPTVSATTRNLGHAVEIRIRDNGTGISAEVKEKMFNPFFTTKPAGEGTGLGLSMSYDIIVKQHGGIIDVDTAIGAFTEFRIILPRAGASLIKLGEHK